MSEETKGLCVEPGCKQPPNAAVHRDTKNGHFFNGGDALLGKGAAVAAAAASDSAVTRRVPQQVRSMNQLLDEIYEVNRKLLSGSVDLDVVAKVQVNHKNAIRLGDLSLQAARVYKDRRIPSGETPMVWNPPNNEK
jgi:hypothetical protein